MKRRAEQITVEAGAETIVIAQQGPPEDREIHIHPDQVDLLIGWLIEAKHEMTGIKNGDDKQIVAEWQRQGLA